MKKIFKKAHELTRKMKESYPEVDYQTQFGLCLSYLLENKEEEARPVSEFKVELGNVSVENPGSFGSTTYEGETSIVKETEKAIQFSFKGIRGYHYSGEERSKWDIEGYEDTIWLPKSQITITKKYIYIKHWLVKKHNTIERLLVHS